MYSNLKSEMRKNEIGNAEIQNLIGTSYQSISNKICGKTSFKIEEAILIRNYYFKNLELEYLFKRSI